MCVCGVCVHTHTHHTHRLDTCVPPSSDAVGRAILQALSLPSLPNMHIRALGILSSREHRQHCAPPCRSVFDPPQPTTAYSARNTEYNPDLEFGPDPSDNPWLSLTFLWPSVQVSSPPGAFLLNLGVGRLVGAHSQRRTLTPTGGLSQAHPHGRTPTGTLLQAQSISLAQCHVLG
jgi:hypothetical protein